MVLCGMGLQFFTDKDAALREFYRVLVPGGRLLANVPGPTPPPFQFMAEGLAQHVGPESASFVKTVFSLHNPHELHSLATQGGFEDVDVRSTETSLPLPSPAEFLWQYVWSTPLAAAVAQVDDERRAALENEFSENCRAFATAGMLTAAVKITTMRATK